MTVTSKRRSKAAPAQGVTNTTQPRGGASTRGSGTRREKSRSKAAEQLNPEESIWQVIHSIPLGRVATYGEVAERAGLPRRARLVGRVLSMLPDGSRLPWHRVVASGGRISVRGGGEIEQARRLRDEGVKLRGMRVDIRRCSWLNGSEDAR